MVPGRLLVSPGEPRARFAGARMSGLRADKQGSRFLVNYCPMSGMIYQLSIGLKDHFISLELWRFRRRRQLIKPPITRIITTAPVMETDIELAIEV
jgi:hypothetical protein